MAIDSEETHSFRIINGGLTGQLFESIDWSKHPLGPSALWPDTLKIYLQVIFHSKMPLLLWWGDELFTFYNDATLSGLGGVHPKAMGQPALENWPESADVINAQLEKVNRGVENTWTDDFKSLTIQPNGETKETYWSYGHSKVCDQYGNMKGVLIFANETTNRIQEERARLKAEETLRQNQETLLQNEERFKMAMNAANMGTWDMDIVNDSSVLSDRTCELLGMPMGSKVSFESGLEGIHPDDREQVRQAVYKAFDPAGTGDFKSDNRLLPLSKDGPIRWVSSVGKTFFEGEGKARKAVRFVGAVLDITERMEQFESLKKLKEAADESNRLKSAFIANISHEIRTPLSSILGFSELLKEYVHDDESARKYLDIVLRNGTALVRLIEDILDISKIEAGRLQIEMTTLSLQKLVEEVVGLFAYKLNSSGVEIRTHYTTEIPNLIVSDATRIRQILVNIIGNAVKFTPKGSISVHVECSKWQDNDKYHIQITVKDSGIGISSSQIKSLFEPFVQCDNSLTRKFGGTGLGLAISRKLARALGGDITIAESKINQGSTFVITFTAAPVPVLLSEATAPRSP